jgi:hypothetical protein
MRAWRVLGDIPDVGLCSALALAQGFKFSNPDPIDQQEKQEKDAAQALAIEQILTPCRADLKDKKIMVLIGERQSNGYIYAEQHNYGPHFDAINRRLRSLGLRTYTPERSADRSRRPRSTRISATTPTRCSPRRSASARASCCAA